MATATLETEETQQLTRRTIRAGNKTFVTTLTDTEAFRRFAELVERGSIQNRFAVDLAKQGRERGWLSPAQLVWVHRFVVENDDRRTDAAIQPIGASRSFIKIVEHFSHAKQNLKYPKIFVSDGETAFWIRPAGAKSKYHGSIVVTSDRSFGANYFGRIAPNGSFIPPAGKLDAAQHDVVALLAKIALDPAGELGRLGKLSGCCAFCQRALTDDRSTALGYGPVCAKRWGLPWGAVAGGATLASGVEGGAT